MLGKSQHSFQPSEQPEQSYVTDEEAETDPVPRCCSCAGCDGCHRYEGRTDPDCCEYCRLPDAPYNAIPDTFSFPLSLGDALPTDLWAIRDLLLIGYAGVFMKRRSWGLGQVERSAVDLARLLPQLHPLKSCRQAMAEALDPAPTWREWLLWRFGFGYWRTGLEAVAEAAWSCLNLTASSFESPFHLSGWQQAEGMYTGPPPTTTPTQATSAMLGVCAGSKWPRACSMWVALHFMAYRADALGLGRTFLTLLIDVIAGGATLCGGCTLHFRLLCEGLLPRAVKRDLGKFFCSSLQCSDAALHRKVLLHCISKYSWGRAERAPLGCTMRVGELTDVQSWQQFSMKAWRNNTLSASAFVVALHNLVTESVDDRWIPKARRRIYCLKEVLASMPADFVSDVPSVGCILPDAAGIPGLGVHRHVNCTCDTPNFEKTS
eukprot:gnl/TRDRNA2_/TRDRNA2_103569_c0_seq2.p1 gnl/TRDRNA2_/TRDRNA2_103569_c0~~gnl/TRDRNA2_/TRDRNA2_103569_c0_seq2.p1  ORF type:complete len:433 (+),score=17.32 gnl/TRDRNA2_/TRDRNA2_103569_c0_seq2:52-1350(+)